MRVKATVRLYDEERKEGVTLSSSTIEVDDDGNVQDFRYMSRLWEFSHKDEDTTGGGPFHVFVPKR